MIQNLNNHPAEVRKITVKESAGETAKIRVDLSIPFDGLATLKEAEAVNQLIGLCDETDAQTNEPTRNKYSLEIGRAFEVMEWKVTRPGIAGLRSTTAFTAEVINKPKVKVVHGKAAIFATLETMVPHAAIAALSAAIGNDAVTVSTAELQTGLNFGDSATAH